MSRRAARFHLPSGEPEAIVVFMSPRVAHELVATVEHANEEYDTRTPALRALVDDIARSLIGPQWEDPDPAEDAIAQLRAMKATELYRGTEDVDAEPPEGVKRHYRTADIPAEDPPDAPDWDDAD